MKIRNKNQSSTKTKNKMSAPQRKTYNKAKKVEIAAKLKANYEANKATIAANKTFPQWDFPEVFLVDDPIQVAFGRAAFSSPLELV